MIRALSPYYIETPLTYTGGTCEKYTLNVWVWEGDFTSPSSENSYQLTYKNTTGSTGTHKINIASMIQDYIQFDTPSTFTPISGTSVRNGNGNQKWVYTFVTYDADDVTKFDEAYDIMTLGYAYGDEGENVDLVTPFLMPQMDYRVNRVGITIVPFFVGEFDFGDITISADGGAAGFTETITPDPDSGTIVRYLWIDLENDFAGAQFLEVEWNGSTITLDIYEEARYTPMDIMFQNKDGAMQTFTFFKDRKEETSVTDSIYESNRGQGKSGYHQFLRYNVQARNSVTASTGFINERENEIIQQILYSRRIWIYDKTNGIYRAVNVKDKSTSFKTKLTERLINYTMKFEYAYNQINNI